MRGQGLSPSLLTPYGRWKLGKKFHKLFTSALPFSILGGGSPQKAHISPVFLYDMSQWFYKRDFQASSIYITWEFVRNRNVRVSPHTYSIRNSRAEAKQSMFSQALLVILSSLKFRDTHSSAVLPGTGGKVC